MDEETAAKTLTGELVNHQGRLVICDEGHKKKLIEEAKYVYVAGDTVETLFKEYDEYRSKPWRNLTKKGYSKNLVDALETSIPSNANYLFYSMLKVFNGSQIHTTPYSIIGDKEIGSIKHLFYKNSDTKIREAISNLGIEDYFRLYNLYFNSNPNFLDLLVSKKEALGFLNSLQYRSDDYALLSVFSPEEINSLNSRLKALNIDTAFDRAWTTRQKVKDIIDRIEETGCPGDYPNFFKFVFELPYEDQNIEANKIIIQGFSQSLDINLILLREYKGQHFRDYFELLNKEQQIGIFDIVKNTIPQNADYNAFLWEKGFKGVSLDYLKLYREDHTGFIEYFSSRSKEGKKAILEGILECDYMNHKAIEWLDMNEPELIKEAGLSTKK